MLRKYLLIILSIFLLTSAASHTALAQGKADIVVKGNITRLQEILFPGNIGLYRVEVENIGTKPAENIRVVMKFNQIQHCLTHLDLKPSETKLVWCGYTQSLVGQLQVEVMVDSAFSVPETNETNNTATNNFLITSAEQRPDINVSDVTVNPNNLHIGDDVLFSVILTNQSKWPTAGFAAAWYLDDSNNAFCSESISLQADESKSSSCLLNNLDFNNTFTVRFVADEHDRLAETNEKNNSSIKKFQVLPARMIPFEYLVSDSLLGTSASSEEISVPQAPSSSTSVESLLINRDALLESQVWEKYLLNLLNGQPIQAVEIERTMLDFITYGVDANTAKLGLGERAAVLYSYKEAYGKIPYTPEDMDDVIRIASGRWPVEINLAAQNKAHAEFYKIYSKIADMDNQHDNAAITIMSYGLRQRATNRNLNSEVVGISIFISIYGHTPDTTKEWNIMQAITYSGASR